MKKSDREKLKKLIDKGFLIDQKIKKEEEKLKEIKKEIKKMTSDSSLKVHRGNKHKVKVSDKNYGYVENNLQVWKACKGDKKLFFDLVKVQVGRLEDTFDEKVIKKLVSYKKVCQVKFLK